MNPWKRNTQLESENKDLRDQLMDANLRAERAQAQLSILRPLFEEEKKAKHNALDRLTNVMTGSNIHSEQVVPPVADPVSFSESANDFVRIAQDLEDKATREHQRRKLELIAHYRGVEDGTIKETSTEETAATASA